MRRLVRWMVLGRPEGLRRTALRALLERLLGAVSPPAPAPARPASAVHDGLVRLMPLDTLRDGELAETLLEGVPVVVVRLGDAVHVLDATCPHAGGPLGDGELEGDALVCPLHGWRFQLDTGACDVDPTQAVRVHEVRVVDGVVCARLVG